MPTVDPVAPASPRWMRLLLLASLALNLLIAGTGVGMILRGGPPPVAVRDLGFGPFAAALSPEDRAALRRDWAARSGAKGDGRRALREDIRALLDTLRADPFDADSASRARYICTVVPAMPTHSASTTSDPPTIAAGTATAGGRPVGCGDG